MVDKSDMTSKQVLFIRPYKTIEKIREKPNGEPNVDQQYYEWKLSQSKLLIYLQYFS